MGLVTSLALIVCGVMAAASLIAAKKPNSKEMIDKLVPYQGWIGLVVCIWGIWAMISSVLTISWISHFPILWGTFLATGVMEFALGFLLGYGLITKYALSKNPEALAKGEKLRGRLATVQIPLGLVGIGLGLWCLVVSFMPHHL